LIQPTARNCRSPPSTTHRLSSSLSEELISIALFRISYDTDGLKSFILFHLTEWTLLGSSDVHFIRSKRSVVRPNKVTGTKAQVPLSCSAKACRPQTPTRIPGLGSRDSSKLIHPRPLFEHSLVPILARQLYEGSSAYEMHLGTMVARRAARASGKA